MQGLCLLNTPKTAKSNYATDKRHMGSVSGRPKAVHHCWYTPPREDSPQDDITAQKPMLGGCSRSKTANQKL